MTNEEAQRRRARQKLELKRMAEAAAMTERGGDEIKRGGDEIKRGGDEIKRGGDEIKRGGDEIKRGGSFRDDLSNSSQQMAMDVFGRAAALGGHLSVTFVTPIGASGRGTVGRGSSLISAVESDAATVDEVVADLIQKAQERRAKRVQRTLAAARQAASRPRRASKKRASKKRTYEPKA